MQQWTLFVHGEKKENEDEDMLWKTTNKKLSSKFIIRYKNCPFQSLNQRTTIFTRHRTNSIMELVIRGHVDPSYRPVKSKKPSLDKIEDSETQ